MYREMVGVGVPIAMQSIVILDPSTTRFTGFIVGGCRENGKYYMYLFICIQNSILYVSLSMVNVEHILTT